MSVLFDRSIAVICALSATLWAVGLWLIVMDLKGVWGTAELGLFSAGLGGVLTICAYLCSLYRREVRAFELGREFGRRVGSR